MIAFFHHLKYYFFRVEGGYSDESNLISRKTPIFYETVKNLYKISNETRQHKNKYIDFRTGPLYVNQVLKTGIPLPQHTKDNHIFEGRGSLTKQEAIHFSAKRGSNINLNTVFDKPKYFKECKTDDIHNPNLTISSHPVQAFQCVRSNSGTWEAHDLGKVYAIFAMDGSHFPGYLYPDVEWPNYHI